MGNGHSFKHDYELQEEIGAGSFASVYTCMQKSTGSICAVKVISKNGVIFCCYVLIYYIFKRCVLYFTSISITVVHTTSI